MVRRWYTKNASIYITVEKIKVRLEFQKIFQNETHNASI